MKMEILKNDLLPAAAVSLLSTKVPETPDTNNTKERGDELLFNDEIEEDEELLLRLSDDEEVKQDSISGQIENQQIEKLDTNEDDCNFNKGITTSSQGRSPPHLTQLIELVTEDSSDNSLDEEGASENCIINDEDSTMSGSDRIPPLMHNSPKYWSSSFDKRWKGVNSSRGRHHFSHRNSNDWYSQQYPDNDKFNGRNNYNNQNKHFNQQRNNKGKYNSQYTENREIKNSEKETEKSSNLKANLSDVDSIINDMNQIIQENGDCNELKSKENNCTVENEKVCKKEYNNIEEYSDKKENKCNSNEERLPDEKCKDSDNIKPNINSECEPTDCKKDNLSVTKDCDTPVSVLANVKSKPESESVSEEIENKFSSNVPEKSNDVTKDLSDFNELSSNKNSARESITTASHDNETLKKTEDQNNILKHQINGDEEAKDEVNDNSDLNEDAQDDEKIESDKDVNEVKEQSTSTNESNDEKLSNNIDTKENSSFSINEKSIDISELEILESHLNESKNQPDATTDDINATTEAEKNTEPSNPISIADFKSCDTEESKPLTDKDEEGSSEMSSLVIDESSQGEKISLDEDEEESNESVKFSKQNDSVDNNDKSSSVEINAPEKMTDMIEEVDLVDNESESTGSTSDNQVETNSLESNKDTDNLLTSNNSTSQLVPISTDSNKNNESNEERTVVSKRRRRKRHNTLEDISLNELPIENGVRQKRRSARNAEEMIRKEILKDDEEDASSDEPSRMVTVHYKKAILQAPPLSPPSLKRTVDELEDASDSVVIKRLKATMEVSMTAAAPLASKEFVPVSKESSTEVKELVRRISTEDIRGKLKKLSQEEMEALLLQKTIECITIRGEMGKLREQARQSKLNHEAARTKCQQLQKQVEGFEMVLKRISFDKNSNSDKFVPPIKITRSVGLQVNFVATVKPGAGSASNPSKTVSTSGSVTMDNRSPNQNSRKMMKTRSPRRVDLPTTSIVQTPNPVTVTTTSVGVGGPVTPTAVVVNKTVDAANKRTITLPSSNIVQLMPTQQPVVVSSNVGGTPNRPATITLQRPNAQQSNNKSNSSDLIDLTDEEDKSKTPAVTPITTTITRPRVLQAFPASVALTNTTNLRLVQAGNQGSQTSIVNNVNTPRLTTYLMQSGANGVPRQLVLANPNTIRPVTSVATRNISTISYKQGVPTLTSGGTVRVLTTQAPTANVQISRHPAPLPDTPAVESNPLWKLVPPAPSLKISKVATGIVLSWNMDLPNNKYAEIVSYQLYAYQEVAGTSPSAALWKKVGDVRALPLPMACTLTQFSEGNNYYFAVRAVDIHSRFGQYSKPGNISL